MGVITEFSFWFLPLCLLLGALYAYLMYVRVTGERVGVWFLRWMTVLRFLTVSIIAFLLLSPVIRRDISIIEKPLIIIGTDNSVSIPLGEDSLFLTKKWPSLMSTVSQGFMDFDTRFYSFGERVTTPPDTGFHEKRTDISSFFSALSTRYLNRNVGAILLFSDGIINYGTDPVYACRDFSWPVYAIALGDTTEKKDVMINRVLASKEVFLTDQFPIEIHTDALLCEGEEVELSIVQQGKRLFSKNITIGSPRFSAISTVMLEAKKPGWQTFSIALTPLKGEVNIENNRRDLFVEVIEERAKIALVYDAPHPDISAIREAFSGSNKYDFREYTPEAFLLNADSFALVVLYQVPSNRGARIADAMISRFPSVLYIVGSSSDVNAFNRMKSGLSIESSRLTFTDAYPLLNRSFPYFQLRDQVSRVMRDFPPLQTPFATYQSSPLLEVCCYQQINGLSTSFPLIAFLQDASQKKGFICGENFWRWRLSDFLLEGDHQSFDELFQKIVQYLIVRPNRSFFKLFVSPECIVDEPVVFTAELLNQSYQPVVDAEIRLEITDEEGKLFPFVFAPAESSYSLNAGKFPQGVYHYRAMAGIGKEKYEKRGSFAVKPVQLEAMRLKADHHLLERLATSLNGTLCYPDQLPGLINEIKENKNIRAISYTQRLYTDLISFPWIFGLLILLLAAEWFARKYTGLS